MNSRGPAGGAEGRLEELRNALISAAGTGKSAVRDPRLLAEGIGRRERRILVPEIWKTAMREAKG